MTEQKTVRGIKKPSPLQFIRQVQREIKKVTWPTQKETMVTTVMVLIIAFLAAVSFLLADGLISLILKPFLG